jgi:hypothetical protein
MNSKSGKYRVLLSLYEVERSQPNEKMKRIIDFQEGTFSVIA